MADIKIEKKGNSLWWLWVLLAVLIIGALIWFFAARNNDNHTVQATDTSQSAYVDSASMDSPAAVAVDSPAVAANAAIGTITDLSTITAINDASLAGRDVRLSNVPVGAMAGDASFWIHDASGKKVYVVLDEVRTPNTPTEGRVDVNQGSSVDLVGTIRNAGDGAPEGAAKGTKTDPLPAGITQYIYAQSAKVVS